MKTLVPACLLACSLPLVQCKKPHVAKVHPENKAFAEKRANEASARRMEAKFIENISRKFDEDYQRRIAERDRLLSEAKEKERLEYLKPQIVGKTMTFEERYAASAAETERLYPQACVPGTAFYNEMAYYDAILKRTNSSLYHDADKPLKIARIIAAALAQGMTFIPQPISAPASPRFLQPSYGKDDRSGDEQTQRDLDRANRDMDRAANERALNNVANEIRRLNSR